MVTSGKNERKYNLIVMFLMVVVMTFIVTLVNNLVANGISNFVFLKWLRLWLISIIVGYPIVIPVMPFLKKLWLSL